MTPKHQMDAKTVSSHNRKDSVVDNTDVVTKPLAIVQNFYAAFSSFTSDHGFQAMNDLAKEALQREIEIQKRDERIKDLRAKLAAQEASHDAHNHQLLSVYESRYSEWKNDDTELRNHKRELEAAFADKNSEVVLLQKQLEDSKTKIGELEREHTLMTRRTKEKDQQLAELDARLQRALTDVTDRTREIEHAHQRLEVLQRSLDDEVDQHCALKEDAVKSRDRIKEFVQLSVKIKGLDIPDV